MVMELCSRGSLYHVLKNYEIDFGWDKVFSLCIEIVKGMDALHSHDPQVLHRDFKSLNVMVSCFDFVFMCVFSLKKVDNILPPSIFDQFPCVDNYCLFV